MLHQVMSGCQLMSTAYRHNSARLRITYDDAFKSLFRVPRSTSLHNVNYNLIEFNHLQPKVPTSCCPYAIFFVCIVFVCMLLLWFAFVRPK